MGEAGLIWDYSRKRTTESVYESIRRLYIDYIDLVNVYDIEFVDLNLVVNETLPALMELGKKGGTLEFLIYN